MYIPRRGKESIKLLQMMNPHPIERTKRAIWLKSCPPMQSIAAWRICPIKKK